MKAGLYIYRAHRPYLPLVAAALHLDAERPFGDSLAAGLRHDWQAVPLFIAGVAADGTVVGCLAHGRRERLYGRTLTGIGSLFELSVAWLDVDRLLSGVAAGLPLAALVAGWLPPAARRPLDAAVAQRIRPHIGQG